MKKYMLLFFFFCVVCVSVSAQKISKPTLTPSEPTASQKFLLQQGIALHDARKYDEAIKKYQMVLGENPNCTIAIYEMAFSYKAKGDTLRAIETATKGAKYKSPELSLFFFSVNFMFSMANFS